MQPHLSPETVHNFVEGMKTKPYRARQLSANNNSATK